MRWRRQLPPSGFTLLETLLAMGIFVAAAALLSRLVLLGIENAEYSLLQSRALNLAQSRLAQLEAGILLAEETGPLPAEEDPDWRWSLSVEPLDDVGLYRVEVRVENIAPGAGQGYSLRLARYHFESQATE